MTMKISPQVSDFRTVSRNGQNLDDKQASWMEKKYEKVTSLETTLKHTQTLKKNTYQGKKRLDKQQARGSAVKIQKRHAQTRSKNNGIIKQSGRQEAFLQSLPFLDSHPPVETSVTRPGSTNKTVR